MNTRVLLCVATPSWIQPLGFPSQEEEDALHHPPLERNQILFLYSPNNIVSVINLEVLGPSNLWAFTLWVPPRFQFQEEKDAPASQNLNLLLCLIVSALFAPILQAV